MINAKSTQYNSRRKGGSVHSRTKKPGPREPGKLRKIPSGIPELPIPKRKKEPETLSAQQSIPYLEMAPDGVCRVDDHTYSKTIRFQDINYQLAQNEEKNAIFENWCDFLNYFDSHIKIQISFINHRSSMREFRKIIDLPDKEDAFRDLREEYGNMLKNQLAKGHNGIVKDKYITFAVEADDVKSARSELKRIEEDVLNNFKVLGVPAEPLSGEERLQILYEAFNPDSGVSI